MEYALIKNGKVIKYPYSVEQLRRDNKNISFPAVLNEDMLLDYGLHQVTHGQDPDYDKTTQKVVNSENPELIDGSWVITKKAVNLSAEEISQKEELIKLKRNQLLGTSDWIVIQAKETGKTLPAAWKTYRQALRDITTHANYPFLNDEDWPTPPA